MTLFDTADDEKVVSVAHLEESAGEDSDALERTDASGAGDNSAEEIDDVDSPAAHGEVDDAAEDA